MLTNHALACRKPKVTQAIFDFEVPPWALANLNLDFTLEALQTLSISSTE